VANIFLTGFNFESAAGPVLYAPRKMRRAALFRFYKRTNRIPSNPYTLAVICRTSIHRSRYWEAMMPVYCAYIVGFHDRTIGVVQLDCRDDESAIKSARRLIDSHPVEVWQTDRPVARLDALSKPACKT
jgi:hypothetical protein